MLGSGRYDVGCELGFAAGMFLRQDMAAGDFGMGTEEVLNLQKIDPHAAHLDLIVQPSHH
jgi:hypothetical protein